jgi:hypothetical protein
MEMFIQSLIVAFTEIFGGAGAMADEVISFLEAVDRKTKRLAISILSSILMEEEGVADEVHAAFREVKGSAWSVDKALNHAKCASKRLKGETSRRKECMVCGVVHVHGAWDESAVGLAGSTLEAGLLASKKLTRKLRRMKVRLAKGEYSDPEILSAAQAEIESISKDIESTREQIDDAHKALLVAMFPGTESSPSVLLKLAKFTLTGTYYLVGTDRKELKSERTRFRAARVVLKVLGLVPALAVKSPKTLAAISDTPEDADGFHAIEFFEDPELPWSPRRLTKREKYLFQVLNSWPGRVKNDEVPGFLADPEDTDCSPLTVGDEYGLLELNKVLGALVRRSDVVFLEDDFIIVPTRVELRDPENLSRMVGLILQGDLDGVKRPYGFVTSVIRNDPRPIGRGSHAIHHSPQYTRKGVEDMVAKISAMAFFWLSGEAQTGDLLPAKPAARRLREPRPVVGRYIRALSDQAFEWVWDCQYHITPIVQTFGTDRGLWLLVQNLSTSKEMISAIRLTGKAAGIALRDNKQG